jgi:hypothetical protein
MFKKIKKLITIFIFIISNKNKKINTGNFSNKIILVEFNNWALLHIAKSLILKFFIEKYRCKIFAYEGYTLLSSENNTSLFKKILRSLMIKFNIGTYGIYKFFGVSKFLRPEITEEIKKEANLILKKNKINSKNQLYNTTLKNIHFGDLIYDSYLKIYNKPTIDINSEEFKFFFNEFVCLFLFWFNFLKKNKSKILNVLFIHEVYSYGIVPRIAVNFDLEGTKISHKSLIKFKKKRFYIGQENAKFYKSVFNKISFQEKKKAYDFSKKKLTLLTNKIPFQKSNPNKIKKILVCCHSIKDSPHVFGKFFYNDFDEWMIALSKISHKGNNIWFIKPHPDDNGIAEKKYYQNLSKKFNNAVLLKPNLSKKVKVDFALTCFGTVGYELPYKDIKVINASRNHPHRFYNFSITPRNKNEYEKYILDPKLIEKHQINKKQILQFYFIKRIYLYSDWIGLNLNKSFDINNRIVKKYYDPSFYQKWYSIVSKKKLIRIYKIINNFYTRDVITLSNLLK